MSAWIGACNGHDMSSHKGEEWMFRKGVDSGKPLPPWFGLSLVVVTALSVLIIGVIAICCR